MSHLTKIHMKITDLELLKKALDRMKLSYTEGKQKLDRFAEAEQVDLKLDSCVGMALQKDGTYAMVGDFYYAQKLKHFYGNNKFFEKLNTSYAIEEATTKLAEKNYYCTENAEGNVGRDGLVTLVFESY